MSDWVKFAQAVEASGLKPVLCSPYHFQITGGKFLINFYPTARGGSKVYVASTKEGLKANLAQAIKFANELPKIEKVERKPNYTKILKWLFRRGNKCFHCGEVVERKDGSVEHIIPLSRGGLNNRNNYALAHQKCNLKKGNQV